MLILSRVCAEFQNRHGQTIFSITPQNLLSFLEAPEEIQEDPLFQLMLQDGSLEAVRSVEQKRNLEADPAAGTTAEGKKTSPKTKKAETGEKPSAEPAGEHDRTAPAVTDSSAGEEVHAETASEPVQETAPAKGRKSSSK